MAQKPDATHYNIRRFKNMAVALKQLERFIRDGAHLQNGKPFDQLDGMRSREAVANWLICAAANFEYGVERMSFCSDPTGGDGVIYDAHTKMTWLTEHVMVRRPLSPQEIANPTAVQIEILNAVALKQEKGGAAYASGKQLVVFLDSGRGEWLPNEVARALPQPLLFDSVWIVGLHGPATDRYIYAISELDLSNGKVPIWLVQI